jgi:DNA-binding MarR family transcriptional regulator
MSLKDDKINKNIVTALEKIYTINRMTYWELGKEDNLSLIQLQFIEFVDKNPLNFCTITNISKEFDLKKSTVSDSISSLIRKGFLEKSRDNKDSRIYYFSLTKKSKVKIKALEKRIDKIINTLRQTPEHEKEIISKFLLAVISNFYFDGSIQSAKICLTCKNFVCNETHSDQPFYCGFIKGFMNTLDLKAYCPHHEDKI